MFNAVRLLIQKPSGNLKLEDATGKQIINPDEIVKTLSKYFESKFQDQNLEHIKFFEGSHGHL